MVFFLVGAIFCRMRSNMSSAVWVKYLSVVTLGKGICCGNQSTEISSRVPAVDSM